MNLSYILNILETCDLSYLDYHNYHQVTNMLPKDFEHSVFRGASKLVIAPANSPYVIKIPFRKTEEGDENLNANSTDHYYWDYCLTETLLYREAKRVKVSDAFAKIKCIGENVDKIRIYIQEKALVYRDHYTECSSYNIRTISPDTDEVILTKDKIITSSGIGRINTPEQWLVDALEYYGSKKFSKIMRFIKEENIYSDLHSGNVGYINGKPVIFDYSGYAE